MQGNLLPDALLAALAIEHGLTLYSADTDFARFRELRWENPLRELGTAGASCGCPESQRPRNGSSTRTPA